MDCHPQTNPWAACDRKNIDRECLAARPEYPAADFSGLRLRQLPDEFDRARIFVRGAIDFFTKSWISRDRSSPPVP